MFCSEKWINLLTICRKAGKLVMGFDSTKEEVLSGRCKGVFITHDASDKTRKEVRFFCEKGNVPMCEVQLTMTDIQNAVGRKAGVIAVCDRGFAERFRELAEAL